MHKAPVTVLLTRAEPDAGRTAQRLRKAGFRVVLSPLTQLRITAPAKTIMAALEPPATLIVTSGNALRALRAQGLAHLVEGRRVACVGGRTAGAMRRAGGRIVAVAPTAARLADILRTTSGPLLHLAGRDRRPELTQAFQDRLEVLTLYAMEPVGTLRDHALRQLQSGDIDALLLYSPRAATLCEEAMRNTVMERPPAVFCLSEAVAEAASAIPATTVRVAANATEAALLAELVMWTGATAGCKDV